jgi:Protein of unknown function (DUF3987)
VMSNSTCLKFLARTSTTSSGNSSLRIRDADDRVLLKVISSCILVTRMSSKPPKQKSKSMTREAMDAFLAANGGETDSPAQVNGVGSIKRFLKGEKPSIHCWEEPDISLLDNRRGELPEFPTEILTTRCRKWVVLAASGAGVTPDYVAVPLLGVSSSLIGTARKVKVHSLWSEPMTSWAALVGFSGSGKTPAIKVLTNALGIITALRRDKIDELRRRHETAHEIAKAELKKWKAGIEQANKDGSTFPFKPAAADDPGVFVAPQLFVLGSTTERLGLLLKARPQGVLAIYDELSRLFFNLKRYTRGNDKQFWLECWNGVVFSVKRMSRPPLYIDYLLVGVVGGIQPDKLTECFAGDDDGMYARFLFSWPGEAPYKSFDDYTADVEPEIINAFDRLSKLGGDAEGFAPIHIPLDREALDIFNSFGLFVSDGKGLLHGKERDWWCKMPAHGLRLAGTLAFLAWAMHDDDEPKKIRGKYLHDAVILVRDYFYLHARAAIRQIGIGENDVNARRILHWIKMKGRDWVSREEIRVDALSKKLNSNQTQELLEQLAKAAWLRPQETKPTTPTGGRPTIRWEVNPKLKQDG